MRGSGLRSRLFRAIGVVVLICVSLTIGLGVVLTHRAVKHATLRDVSHQADLIAGTQASGVPSVASLPKRIKKILKQQHEGVSTNPQILPAWAQEPVAHRQPVQGTVSVNGTAYYFAARWANPGTLILLRPQSTADSFLSPYVWGLLVAAAAGGLLAALAAFLLRAASQGRSIGSPPAPGRSCAAPTRNPCRSRVLAGSRRSPARSKNSTGSPRR